VCCVILRKQDTYFLKQANKRLRPFKQHLKIVHGFVPVESGKKETEPLKKKSNIGETTIGKFFVPNQKRLEHTCPSVFGGEERPPICFGE
jgi:hypothetical protein